MFSTISLSLNLNIADWVEVICCFYANFSLVSRPGFFCFFEVYETHGLIFTSFVLAVISQLTACLTGNPC